jgi:hypothetical protein
MEEVGLIPSDTGKPGGKKTGQSMTHNIEEKGKYETVFSRLPESYLLPFTSVEGDLIVRLINGVNGLNGSDPVGKNPISSKKANLIRPGRKKTKYSCLVTTSSLHRQNSQYLYLKMKEENYKSIQ